MFRFLKALFKNITSVIITIIAFLLGITFILTIIYPLGYRQEIVNYASQYNLDPILVATVINVESNYNKDARSHQDARGLMQIVAQTGEWGAQELGLEDYNGDSLYDPNININIGSWYLNKLNYEFESDKKNVLAAYNAGSGNVKNWLNNEKYSHDGKQLYEIPFDETKNYIEKIEKRYELYSNIYSDVLYQDNKFMDIYFNFIIKLRQIVKSIGEG